MLCLDIMRRPVEWVSRGDSVQNAAKKMIAANIGFLPVCDERHRVVGVVTDRDLAMRCCAPALPADKTPVDAVMTTQVVHCDPQDDLSEVERLMTTHQKSRIPLIDRDGALVGVVSLADLALVATSEVGETLRSVSRREVLSSAGTKAF